ncbi:MAG TPA: peroxide stress protein YaaA [Candidatus Avilachnospira avistercoris]|nr:peroxide stress protein YaaA [Candidatus Avilachnospira avistercoris]
MRIIIAPAKQMKDSTDLLEPEALPVFLDRAEQLRGYIQSLSFEEQKKLWACNERIAWQNHERFRDMDLRKGLTPAILSYDGIQYKYMAPAVFETRELSYIEEHLRILSGFYGVLKPMDGVVPYRLEMQAKASPNGCRDLYDFWGKRLYQEVRDESGIIINLASKEYSKCIERYLGSGDRFITCIFGELSGGKVVQKGVHAKMARGEMVRYMASLGAKEPEAIKGFSAGGYAFDEDRSSADKYVFLI